MTKPRERQISEAALRARIVFRCTQIGMSPHEIAVGMGMTKKAAATYLHRALKDRGRVPFPRKSVFGGVRNVA